jgi:hypothetical protein
MDLLMPLKGTWINTEVPENISFECARFLLSAPDGVVLTAEEKKIYEEMRRYKLIELNLDSSIEVLVPWTPAKTRSVGDAKIQCKKCLIKYRRLLLFFFFGLILVTANSRSVTLMSAKLVFVCGMCIPDGKPGYKNPQKFPAGSDVRHDRFFE